MAKLTPATSATGQVCLIAALAVDDHDQQQRDERGQERGLPADDGADLVVVDAGQVAGGDDRDGDRAERDGGGVGQQHGGGGPHRGEAERDEHDAGDRDRGAEAGQRFEQAAEAERDDDALDARDRRRPG